MWHYHNSARCSFGSPPVLYCSGVQQILGKSYVAVESNKKNVLSKYISMQKHTLHVWGEILCQQMT